MFLRGDGENSVGKLIIEAYRISKTKLRVLSANSNVIFKSWDASMYHEEDE
jgi:hypothetical protein